MAAKGSVVKAELMKKLLDFLPDSFTPDNKEIRVDMVENGLPVQIKITLTAVKNVIANSPESQVINEESFHISNEEETDLMATLKEMGVNF